MEDREKLISELRQIERDLASIEENIRLLQEQKENLEDSKSLLLAQIDSLEDEHDDDIIISCQSGGTDWENGRFSWTDKLHSTLNETFGLTSFRPLQLSCMNAILSQRDVILVMPTGGGKSLCYQLPAVINCGFTLVVSPLVSLMEDQLMSVKRYNIRSEMLNASSTKQQINEVHSAMINRTDYTLKLVYVTPEKISKSKTFMSKLEKAYEAKKLTGIIIDEVHCTSQWGHDFRPDYKFLGILKRQFPQTPVMGLTATATDKVLEDCKSILNLGPSCLVFKASYNRPNLFYEIREKLPSHKDQMDRMQELIKTKFNKQSGIVYCFSQKDVEQVCEDLCQRGIKASCYHANMPPKDKTKVHTLWTNNNIQVIVATIAFGMGIDKSDVRFVIHHSLSKSMENYYQESGRAGRDGEPAVCILYYKLADIFRQSTMIFKEHAGLLNLYTMVRYCINSTTCRRYLIAHHFGEIWKEEHCQKMCDICQKGFSKTEEDVTRICHGFLEILDNKSTPSKRLTALKLVDLWKTSSVAKELANTKPSIVKLEKVLVHCLLENIFKEDLHFTPYNTISYIVNGPKAFGVQCNRVTVTMETIVRGSGTPICCYPTGKDTGIRTGLTVQSTISVDNTKDVSCKNEETMEEEMVPTRKKRLLPAILTTDDDFMCYKRRYTTGSNEGLNNKGKGKSSDVWFSSRSKLDTQKRKSLSLLKFSNSQNTSTPDVSKPTTSFRSDVIEIDSDVNSD